MSDPMFRKVGGALVPLKRALTLKERQAVRAIPGAQVDEETGETRGADHAVWTVVQEFGCEGTGPLLPYPLLPLALQRLPRLSPYQLDGLARMRSAYEDGALCHDDVGLGKTPQAIAALCGSDLVKLVLCPAFLRGQWKAEVERWTTEFRGTAERAYVLDPKTRKAKTEPAWHGLLQPGNWVIAFYRDAEEALSLVGSNEYALVVDEAHNLRSLGTKQTEGVLSIATWASARIGLTGDVLVNNIAKLWPVLNIIQPGAFGTFFDFTARYCNGRMGDYGWVVGNPQREDELRRRMSFFAYRRTWDDIPAKQRPFDTRMLTTWVKVEKSHKALRSILVKGIAAVKYAEALADAKMEVIIDALLNDKRAKIPSITFTLLKKHARELREAMGEGLVITGDLPSDSRLAKIARYVKECGLRKRTPMVFATFGAIGEGANLQWAKLVNFAALPFGSDVIRQAFARAARRGNEGIITGRFFVARGTADEYLMELMKTKLKTQLKLAGKSETAKVKMLDALTVSQEEIKNVMARMLERARTEERG